MIDTNRVKAENGVCKVMSKGSSRLDRWPATCVKQIVEGSWWCPSRAREYFKNEADTTPLVATDIVIINPADRAREMREWISKMSH